MSDLIRLSRDGEESALSHIWSEVFGDTDEYIAGFFTHVYEPGGAVVAEVNGRAVSCAHLFHLGDITDGDWGVGCTVSYAFGTLEEYRGRGLGGRVAQKAAEISENDKNAAATICPAEDSLFGYYEKKVGYSDFFYCTGARYTACRTPAGCGKLREVSAGEYSEIREKLLFGRTHVRLLPSLMKYQERLSKTSGGGLYVIELDDVLCCAAVEGGRSGMFVKELLCPAESREICAGLLMRSKGAEDCFVRMPVCDGDTFRRHAMLRKKFDVPISEKLPWYGFCFD